MATDITLRELLVPTLEAEFPGRGMRVGAPPDAVAVFPAACAEVGEVQIFDDGDEATLVIEHVSHSHFNPYDYGLTAAERAQWITREVVEFLRELFSDRVLLWTAPQRGSGGWRLLDEGEAANAGHTGANAFVWSRRLAIVRERRD